MDINSMRSKRLVPGEKNTRGDMGGWGVGCILPPFELYIFAVLYNFKKNL